MMTCCTFDSSVINSILTEQQVFCHRMYSTRNTKLIPGVNLVKLFWHKFDHTFCKLDYFINVTIIFLSC